MVLFEKFGIEIQFAREFAKNCLFVHLFIFQLLEMASIMEKSVVPLLSVQPVTLYLSQTDKNYNSVASPPSNFDEKIAVRSCINHLASFTETEPQCIFDVIGSFLAWLANETSCACFLYDAREVLIQCYRRWVPTRGNTTFPAITRGDELIYIMVAEIGCREALFVCSAILLISQLPVEIEVKMHWALAINGVSMFSSDVN